MLLVAACGRLGFEPVVGGITDDTTMLPPSDARSASGLVYANSPRELYRIDPMTRAVTSVGAFNGPCAAEPMTDIAIDQSGVLIGVTFDNVYRIDAETAACELLAPLPRDFNGLSFVPSGDEDILVGTTVMGELYQIDAATGMSNRIARYGGGVQSAGDLVAVRGVGTFAAVRRMSDTTDHLARVDVATGTTTVIGDTGFFDVFGLGYWNGSVYGFTNSRKFVLIDLTTGAGTLVEQGTVTWWGAGVTTNAE